MKKKAPREVAQPLSFANRRGAVYFLHVGTTKTGKPRYFVAKTALPGALTAMPAGYEFCESINGTVSVRRKSSVPDLISESDLTVARQELARHPHLRRHVLDARKDEIVLYEPLGLPSERELQQLGQLFGRDLGSIEKGLAAMQTRMHYTPVMKFAACAESPGEYLAYRRFYRGDGGWLLLSGGSLKELCRAYTAAIGTDQFFELY